MSFSSQSLSLGPGSSSSITITISVPSNAAPGTYAGYMVASTGTYAARLPIVVVVPASLREDASSFSAVFSTIVGVGLPEWVVFRLNVSQPLRDLAGLVFSSEGPAQVAVYAITPSGRLVTSTSNLYLGERGEYIVILETLGTYTLKGPISIMLSSPKISQSISQIGVLATNISSLRSGLDSVNSSLTQGLEMLRSSLQVLNMSFAQQIDVLGRNLSTLAQAVGENSRLISSLSSSLQSLASDTQRRFSGLEETLSRAVGNITNISDRLSSFQRDVQQTLASQQNSITEIRSNISTLSQSLGNVTIASIAGIVLAIIGIAMGALSLSRTRRK